MSMKRNLPGVLGTFALLAGGLLGGGAPAAAGDDSAAAAATKYCRSNNHGSYVCFQPAGDKLIVKDTAKDGYSASAYWDTSYGRGGVCLNEHGKGEVVVCNYNMAEGKRIKFWAVNIDQPTNKYRYWSTHLETTI
jgi:hypothetical protein